jgi:hypothetical protein
MTIRVLNLPDRIAIADLEPLFSPYGAIEQIELLPETHTALVSLAQGEDAAIQALDGTEWQGILLSLEDGRGKGPKH